MQVGGHTGGASPGRTSRPMQLIEDKKSLGEKCAAVVAELKQGEQRRQEREAQMREQHALVSGRGARLPTTPPSLCPASEPVTGRVLGGCGAGATAWAVRGAGFPAPAAPADARLLAGRRSRSSKS